MKQEVAIKQSTEVSTDVEKWGAAGGNDLETSDLVKPQIIVLQKMSKFVDDGVGKAGDIVEIPSKTVIGGEKDSIELIIFFRMPKKWKVSDISGAVPKWVRYEDYKLSESDLPWTFTENNTPHRRDKVISYVGLMVKKGEPLEANLPCIISFSRSLIKYSQKPLQTYFEKLDAQGKNSADMTMVFTSKREEKDGSVFYVFSVKPGRATTKEELIVAKNWYNKIKAGEAKFEESHHDDDEVTAPVYAKPKSTYTVDDADADDDIDF